MKRPLLLSILMWFASIYAVGAVLGIFAVVFDLGRFIGGYSMGGMAVSREAWLRIAAPLVAIVALLMEATAIGLKYGRRWSRFTAYSRGSRAREFTQLFVGSYRETDVALTNLAVSDHGWNHLARKAGRGLAAARIGFCCNR